MAPPLFWDLAIFHITKVLVDIFLLTPHIMTNGTLNMDPMTYIYALPKELPYFSHLYFIKWT